MLLWGTLFSLASTPIVALWGTFTLCRGGVLCILALLQNGLAVSLFIFTLDTLNCSHITWHYLSRGQVVHPKALWSPDNNVLGPAHPNLTDASTGDPCTVIFTSYPSNFMLVFFIQASFPRCFFYTCQKKTKSKRKLKTLNPWIL